MPTSTSETTSSDALSGGGDDGGGRGITDFAGDTAGALKSTVGDVVGFGADKVKDGAAAGAQAVFKLLWDSIGADGARIVLYIVLVLGAVGMGSVGVARMSGGLKASRPAAQGGRGMSEHETPEEHRRERLGEGQAISLERVEGYLEELLANERRRQTPAEPRLVVLSQGQPTQSSDGIPAKSFGVLNPTRIPIYLGVGGGSPTPEGRAISVAPRALLVLPIAVTQIVLGG